MSLRTSLAGLLLVAVAAPGIACHRMAAVDKPVPYIEGAKPARIWVTKPSGETFIVEGPQLFGDTLVGYVNGEYREIAFAGTEQVIVRQPARTRTAMLIAASIVGTATFAYLITSTGTQGNSERFNTDCDDDPSQPACM